MRMFFFIPFLLSLAKAGLWISIGLLIKDHFETILSLIIRKPVPEGLIEQYHYEKVRNIIKWIGIFIIIIGAGIAVTAFSTMVMGAGIMR
ncbi:hypothetical protein ACE01N_00310 [Saccharicrinis sp. FJH2]|uniref:hypothetical protein n=1 Tax=unclassified Saccharicrinis TaxID=2646859 RepID=UPI0035D4FFD2